MATIHILTATTGATTSASPCGRKRVSNEDDGVESPTYHVIR